MYLDMRRSSETSARFERWIVKNGGGAFVGVAKSSSCWLGESCVLRAASQLCSMDMLQSGRRFEPQASFRRKLCVRGRARNLNGPRHSPSCSRAASSASASSNEVTSTRKNRSTASSPTPKSIRKSSSASKKVSKASSLPAGAAKKSRGNPNSPTSKRTASISSARGSKPTNPVAVGAKAKEAGRRRGKRLRNVFERGDFVTHERFGLGRYLGIEVEETPSTKLESVVVAYRDGELSIPVTELESLSRYDIRKGEQRSGQVQLDMMSSHREQDERKQHRALSRARRTARAAIKSHIVNMYGLYASRRSYRRPVHAGDEELENKFCELFPYELTNDQRSAIEDILSDMGQSKSPMDRLVCGDVGFGKTEVAMRAVFRALCSGKQVGILAPTTILAHQHFATVSVRLSEFPQFKVGRLSRFVRTAEQEETLAALESGDIQVLVGTHSMLGSRVVFKDLGLLVIDEEHRFGVNQKEKLRMQHTCVDALMLSATPIPRTLHISLSGMRDVSVIRTPPKARKPVVTQVVPSGKGPLREAIERELDRDGQLFYVVPRISMMEAAYQMLIGMFPKLRVVMAHAEMRDLEERVSQFANREADVLLCTSIVENGIDLPFVNTMVIESATLFGLSQLHQLRGRVGRGVDQAYAYLMYDEQLHGTKATGFHKIGILEELNDLGSGFAIANKDMEIRGVGNVLGVEQSGRLGGLSVQESADILCEELELARLGVTDDLPPALPVVSTSQILLPLQAMIPVNYAGGSIQRKMMVYAAFASASTLKEVARARKLTENRFGPMPSEVHQYVKMMELKVMCKLLGINRVYLEREHVVLEWSVDESQMRAFVALLDERDASRRFLHISSDERVQIRGLALSKPDVVLAKLCKWLHVFYLAALELKRAREHRLALLRDAASTSGRLEEELRRSSRPEAPTS